MSLRNRETLEFLTCVIEKRPRRPDPYWMMNQKKAIVDGLSAAVINEPNPSVSFLEDKYHRLIIQLEPSELFEREFFKERLHNIRSVLKNDLLEDLQTYRTRIHDTFWR